MYSKTFIFFLVTTLLFIFSPIQGSNIHAYDSLEVGILYDVNINRNSFHHYWNQNWGFELFVSTPFYWGQLHTGLVVNSFDSRDIRFVNFTTYFLYFGWGVSCKLPCKFNGFSAIHLGNVMMQFHPGSKTPDVIYDPEDEFALRLSCGLSYPLHKNLYYKLNIHYHITYLNKRIELNILSTGVSYYFNTPKWLKEFLQ
jgi:hypothetical protein